MKTFPSTQTDSTVDSLRAVARATFAGYAQYDGYFDTWTRARVTRRLRSKGGLMAEVGDFVLASPDSHNVPGVVRGEYVENVPVRSFFSWRLGWNCSVRPSALKDA